MTREELFRALGEVREDQILEAERLEKKRRLRFPRRAGAAAACLALVVITVTASSAASWVRDQIRWKALIGSFHSAAVDDPTRDGPAWDGGGEDPDGAGYWSDGETRPASNDSRNVEIGELAGPGDGGVSLSACWSRLPEAAEVFGEDTEIFRGTVQSLRYYQVETSSGHVLYYTVAQVEITDPIRGGPEKGERCTLLYAGARGYCETSASGPLNDLETGSEAVFMAAKTGKETGWSREGDFFCYADLADYYMQEGEWYAFLDTGSGLEFDRAVYKEIAGAETLEEVEDYIRSMTEG